MGASFLRIVAGSLRGKKLVSPEGETTRPTHERTREAVFAALQAVTPGARVLDAFAGSGAMALEALSRGAESAILLERDEAACRAIERNIRDCRLEERARLIRGDALKILETLEAEPFDLVLLDPPYGKGLIERALELLLRRGLLAEDVWIVAETAAGEALDLSAGFFVAREKKYGKNLVRFLCREDGPKREGEDAP